MDDQDPTKARLLEAAGAEFAERGFEAATVRAICDRAGANVAAINYHFGGKEALYEQAVMEAYRCGAAGDAPAVDDDEPPAEQLRRFVGHLLREVFAVSGDSWQHELMLRELGRPTGASARIAREAIAPKFRRLIEIVGRLAPGLDERARLATAFSVVGQCLFYKMSRPIRHHLVGPDRQQGLDVEYLTDHITRFSLAALGHAAGPVTGEAER